MAIKRTSYYFLGFAVCSSVTLSLLISAKALPQNYFMGTFSNGKKKYDFFELNNKKRQPNRESPSHSALFFFFLFFPQVCLLGKSRNYQLSDEPEVEQQRAHYIHSRCTAPGVTVQRSDVSNDEDCCNGDGSCNGTPGSSWGAGFQPRDRVEAVRNCAALPRDFVDGVVLRVANALLGMTAGDGEGSCRDWNQGGKTIDMSRC